jgi:hypothetical protein
MAGTAMANVRRHVENRERTQCGSVRDVMALIRGRRFLVELSREHEKALIVFENEINFDS